MSVTIIVTSWGVNVEIYSTVTSFVSEDSHSCNSKLKHSLISGNHVTLSLINGSLVLNCEH